MKDPMSHHRADAALEWVQGYGTPEERAAFESEMAFDPELSELAGRLAESAALLARSIPQVEPPEELGGKLMDRLGEQEAPSPSLRPLPKATESVPPTRPKTVPKVREILAWAAAIALAGGCVSLWKRQSAVENQLAKASELIDSLSADLNQARESRDLARVEVETLKATIDEYREGVALVVWDAEKQEGVLKLEKMPPIPVDQDYQLWVVDPDHENPVDAGVVRVDDDGFARVKFKPVDEVTKAEKFAISVEARGGVPVGQGPIVLLSP